MQDDESRRYTAVICMNGHTISHSQELTGREGSHCETCGAKNITACTNPTCLHRILGAYDGIFYIGDSSPPSYCPGCGEAYPWRQNALRRMSERLTMQAELLGIDMLETDRLQLFAADLLKQTVTPSDANLFGRLFTKKHGKEAARTVGALMKETASNVIADVIKKTMMGGIA